MNLIQVLLQLLVLFGGKSVTKHEISAVLSVVVQVANVLMDELHVREKREQTGDTTASPFHLGNWDVLVQTLEQVTPVEKVSVTEKKPRSSRKKLN